MSLETPVLGQNLDDRRRREIKIDVPKLIETRLLITATSGQGKSWALRRILEQTHGHVQHIIIDPEGEFYTLRELFDYVIARTGNEDERDCPADLRSAELLARKLLELRVPAILDIYDMKPEERPEFVKLFLESLMNAPRNLWHPVLVVIDEAQLFAPQEGKAVSSGAVIDLMSRGRKRGFTGCLASQRFSMVDKNALSICRNVLIGGFTLDVDVDRAVRSLGFTGRDAGQKFRGLLPGQFFVHGPAFCRQVSLVKIGKVLTTHPKAGQEAPAPAAPRATVRAVLGQLADLPAEAEKLVQTEASLRAEVARLQKQVEKLGKEKEANIIHRLHTGEIEVEDVGQIDELKKTILRLEEQLRERDRELLQGKAAAQPGDKSDPIPAVREALVLAGLPQTPNDGTIDQIVSAVLARLKDHPQKLVALMEHPHIEVDYTPVTTRVDGTTFRGRVARLIAEGWFNEPRTNQQIAEYLTKTGARAVTSNVNRDIPWFILNEFLERSGEGYIASKTAAKRIKT